MFFFIFSPIFHIWKENHFFNVQVLYIKMANFTKLHCYYKSPEVIEYAIVIERDESAGNL